MKQTKQFLRPLLMAIVMLVGMLVPKGAWAQSSPVTVGDEGFSTIQDAIDHIVYGEGFNATLTLHQDFTLGDVESIAIDFYYFTEYFNFTIDLNGHTITGGCEWSTNAIEFYNHGEGLPTVTIANSCQDKKGKLFNCSLDLNSNTKVIVKEGVSIYPSSELLESCYFVFSINSETSSVENYGDIYGGVGNNNGGSFINNGSVAYVNGEFVNNGSYCAYFNWADDGSSFIALVYGGIYYYNEGDEFASITSVVTKEPTCTEPGVRTFTGTFEGFTDTKEVEIPACHDYQVQNVVWSEDYTTAILQLVCSRDAEHTANVEVTGVGITSEDTTPATCTTAGVRTYTAKATYEGVEYTGIKEVEISATGHDFKDQVIAENQGEDGYYHYGCSRCDELDSNYSFAKMFGAFREVTDDEAPTETIQLTKVGNYYYASLYTDFPYVVGGDDVAYYVTSAENGVVTLDNTAYVRAGSGVIFRSTNSECTIEYDPEGFENTAPEDNLLTGSDEAFVPNANQYAFGLSNEGFLGFWRWPNMTIPAWKAYLELDEETAARGFRIVFDDETNGIQQLPTDASAIEGCYDLMGRKVREVKGLGIVNGRKVYVK